MTDKHTLAPPELAEHALVEELATQMAMAAGYAPHCWPTWEQEATVIIPTIAKYTATRIAALEAEKAELVDRLEASQQVIWQYKNDLHYPPQGDSLGRRLAYASDTAFANEATLTKVRQSEGAPQP